MAQIEQESGMQRRLRALARQRPGMLVAGTLFVGLLAGSASFGVVQAANAGGMEIERLDRTDEARTVAKGDGGSADGGEPDPGATERTDGEPADGRFGKGGDGGVAGSDAAMDAIVVDVSGAVAEPSVVTLSEGDRVRDAIEEAGGLLEDADVAGVNRAAKLVDGQQVYIPRVGEGASAAAGVGGGTVNDPIASQGTSQLVNINTATAEELDTLSGVGPSTAQAIIDEREADGPFASVEDLMRVSGIGEKKFEKLKSAICV